MINETDKTNISGVMNVTVEYNEYANYNLYSVMNENDKTNETNKTNLSNEINATIVYNESNNYN